MQNSDLFKTYKGTPCQEYKFITDFIDRIELGEEKLVSLENHSKGFSCDVSLKGLVASIRTTYSY